MHGYWDRWTADMPATGVPSASNVLRGDGTWGAALAVDIGDYGASPSADGATNLAAINEAIGVANASGAVVRASVCGTYDIAGVLDPITTGAGIDMTCCIFNCTDAAQTGPFLSIGRPVQGGDIGKVVRGIRVKRATVSDWSDEAQIGVLLRCLRATDAQILQVSGFTVGLRCQAEYDGTLAVDFVHNTITIGQIHNARYLVDMYSLSPSTAGAPNSNVLIGGNLVSDTGVNTSMDRYAWCFRRSVWWQGAIAADASANTVTLTGGTVPVNGRIEFTTDGTLPDPLVTDFAYWVVSSVGSVVQVAVTQGGSAIDIVDAGTGNHAGISQGYFNHNHNVWLAPAFQHARAGSGVAYCILNAVAATQNNVMRARAEYGTSTMRGSLNTYGGGPNRSEIDYATSYLRDELYDVYATGVIHGAWRTVNNRYGQTAIEAMRPLIVIPDLRKTMFKDYRNSGVSSDFSYGFDDLHVTYTVEPPGGVGTATMAICALRNDQRGAFSSTQGIIPNADSVTIGSARGIGIFIDTTECKWLVPMITQKNGARSYRFNFRQFDASGVLLGEDTPLYVDMPSLTLTWNATGLYWYPGNNQTDSNQATRVGYRVHDDVKFVQVAVIYPGADVEDIQSFAVYTPEPYQARAFHGVTGGTRELYGEATWDPDDIPDGQQDTTTFALTGAARGDICSGGFSLALSGLIPFADSSANDTARFGLANLTGGNVNLASGTVHVRCMKPRIP